MQLGVDKEEDWKPKRCFLLLLSEATSNHTNKQYKRLLSETYPSNAPGVPLSFDVRELILPEYLLEWNAAMKKWLIKEDGWKKIISQSLAVFVSYVMVLLSILRPHPSF